MIIKEDVKESNEEHQEEARKERISEPPRNRISLYEVKEDRNPEIKSKPVSLYATTTYKAQESQLSLQDFVEVKVEK